MDWITRVQFLNEVVCISHNTKTLNSWWKKIQIQLFSLQQWVNSRADRALSPCYSYLSNQKKLDSKTVIDLERDGLCQSIVPKTWYRGSAPTVKPGFRICLFNQYSRSRIATQYLQAKNSPLHHKISYMTFQYCYQSVYHWHTS